MAVPERQGAGASTGEQARRRTRPGAAAALIATSLGFGVVQLDVSVVNVAIRSIGSDLGGSVDDLQWVVNAYTLAFAALILTAGALGDRVGAKRVFVAGFAIFTFASVGCGCSPDLASLIAARAVQGIGAAILVPCSLSLLSHAYPDPGQRAKAIGFWAAGASTALSAGPLVGGALLAVFDWRAIFFINVPLGLLAIWLTVRYARETSRSPERRFDVVGQSIAIVSLTALAAAMIQGGQLGFGDPRVLVGFGIAAAAGAGFVCVERRVQDAMLPPALFAERMFATATTLGLLVNVAFYGLIFVLSLYFQTTLGYSGLETGLAFAPTTVAVLLANLLSGRITRRFGIGPSLTVAFAAMAVALLGLLVVGKDSAYPVIVGQLVALGLSLGVIVPAITAAMLGSVDTNRSGVASGTLNTARQTGSVIGVSLFGALLAPSLLTGIRLDLIIAACLSVLCMVITRLMKDTRPQT